MGILQRLFGKERACAKCGRTWSGLEAEFKKAKEAGVFIYGEGTDVLLYCDSCKKYFCGRCQADLGMDPGCPLCNRKLTGKICLG